MAGPLLFILALAAAGPTTTRDKSQASGDSVAERSADPVDKVICKKFAETGSLVKATRICKTKAEWQRGRDDVRTRMSLTGQMSCASGGGGSCF